MAAAMTWATARAFSDGPRLFGRARTYGRYAALQSDFGAGVVEVRSCGRGVPLDVIVRRAWNPSLAAAGLAGVFEAVEGAGAAVHTEDLEGGVRVVVDRVRGAVEEGRRAPERPRPPGDGRYPMCHRCGAPVSLKAFEWDPGSGSIVEREGGRAVVYLPALVVERALELSEGARSDARLAAVRAHADRVREDCRQGRQDPERDFFELLGVLRRRSVGNPIFEELDGTLLTVRVRNPASAELVMGSVLGCYEAVTGFEGRVLSKRSDDIIEVAVSPA